MATPAHPSDESVERNDVIGLVLLLQTNLFEHSFPEPGHSVPGLFGPVKSGVLADEGLDLLRAQIKGLRPVDIRTAFGFMLDGIIAGDRPTVDNIVHLFPSIWERAGEDLRKTAGAKYHALSSKVERGEFRRRIDCLSF